jgi:O-antigen ligase
MTLTRTFPRDPVSIGRGLVIACAIAILMSPPLANLAQALLLICFVLSAELRARAVAALRQPLVLGSLAFALVLVIAATYSAAPPQEAYGALSGWRKVLLVWAAAALFDTPDSKRRLAQWFAIATAIFAVISYISLATGTMPIPVRRGEFPGTVVRNHATQGVMFAVGAFCAAALLFGGQALEKRWRQVLAACLVVLVSNVVLVTTGRSGYVALMACAGCGALAWVLHAGERRGRAILLSGLGLLVLGALLFASPRAREGIDKALHETRTYEQQQGEFTSMGIRQYFWRNALVLIQQKPLQGHGTASFEHAYGKLVQGRPGVAGTPSSDPHQQFLKIATEQGLVGLAVFLAFLATATRQRASQPWRVLGLGVLGAWCLTSMANSHFSTFAEGSFIYLWLGAMLANEGRQAALNAAPAP